MRLDGKVTRLEDKLDERSDHWEQKIDALEKRLDEKIDGLSKRLDSQAFISCSVLIGLIVASLSGLAKLFGFAGNP